MSPADGSQTRSDERPAEVERNPRANRMAQLKGRVRQIVSRASTYHHQGAARNIFVFSTPRSGSTWLAELLATQGQFKFVNEPCNLRLPVVRDNLGIQSWQEVFLPQSKPLLRKYLQSFVDGRDTDWRFQSELPFSELWHLRTDRVIFKILFAGEDDINWFRDTFNGYIVFLLRHPIAVSISREQLPRLESFLTPPFCENFTGREIDAARRIVDSGTQFEKSILDWSLQNAVPLRQIRDDWVVLSYEQLVLEPEIVVPVLAKKLSLEWPDKMLQRIFKASRSTVKSSEESKNVLLDPEKVRTSRRWLVEKWQKKITPQEQARAFEILSLFDIDFYQSDRFLPAQRYMLGSAA